MADYNLPVCGKSSRVERHRPVEALQQRRQPLERGFGQLEPQSPLELHNRLHNNFRKPVELSYFPAF